MNKKRYLQLIDPAVNLVASKGEDYNSGVKLTDYFPFGHKSYVQMIHLKAKRLVSLAEVAEPNHEGVKDTLLDLLNYTVFYLDALEAEDEQPL
jgi:hypothetical protein